MNMWFWIALLVMVIAVGLIQLIGAVMFRIYTKPMHYKIKGTPAEYGLSFKDFEFNSNGEVHKVWMIYPPRMDASLKYPAVITTHGYATNRWDIVDRSASIAKAGIPVFSFDWRASGESGGSRCSGGLLERQDLENAISCLREIPQIDAEKIGLYGFSMGATVSLIIAAADERIKCVVADSPFSNLKKISNYVISQMFLPLFPFSGIMDAKFVKHFGGKMHEVDVLSVVQKISPRPILMFAGEKDRTVPIAHAREIFAIAREPKELLLDPEGDHFSNASPENLEQHVIPFLKKHLV